MQVTSKVKFNMPRIKQLTSAAVTALEQTAEAVHTEVEQAQVVPRDTGALQNEKMFVDTSDSKHGTVRIIHEGPYARRLYYHPEYHFQKLENPNAGGEWFKDWLPGGSKEDFAINAYKQLYKRLGGV